jgi:hypothetical protein
MVVHRRKSHVLNVLDFTVSNSNSHTSCLLPSFQFPLKRKRRSDCAADSNTGNREVRNSSWIKSIWWRDSPSWALESRLILFAIREPQLCICFPLALRSNGMRLLLAKWSCTTHFRKRSSNMRHSYERIKWRQGKMQVVHMTVVNAIAIQSTWTHNIVNVNLSPPFCICYVSYGMY